MKKIIPTLLMASVCCTPVIANADNAMDQFDISVNATLVSDYVFRGISQSDEGVALQSGVDVAHETGLYAGAWGSSVDFNDNDEASVEIDVYAGYAGEINSVSYDIGGIYYLYPGADSSLNYDFFEIYAALGYDFGPMAATVGVNYSPDFYGATGDAVYSHLNIDVPVTEQLSFNAGVGHQTIEDGANYTDWNAGLSYAFDRAEIFLSYHDTDLDEPGECADGCSDRVVVGIGTEF